MKTDAQSDLKDPCHVNPELLGHLFLILLYGFLITFSSKAKFEKGTYKRIK